MEKQECKIVCPMVDAVKEYYPIIPFVIPLIPMLLVGCLWMHLRRITRSIERQEALLEETLVDIRQR